MGYLNLYPATVVVVVEVVVLAAVEAAEVMISLTAREHKPPRAHRVAFWGWTTREFDS